MHARNSFLHVLIIVSVCCNSIFTNNKPKSNIRVDGFVLKRVMARYLRMMSYMASRNWVCNSSRVKQQDGKMKSRQDNKQVNVKMAKHCSEEGQQRPSLQIASHEWQHIASNAHDHLHQPRRRGDQHFHRDERQEQRLHTQMDCEWSSMFIRREAVSQTGKPDELKSLEPASMEDSTAGHEVG